jgi:hypothetical protein
VHEAIRRRHLCGRTEESYVNWIKRYIYVQGMLHPATMGEREIEAFLTYPAVERKGASPTLEPGFRRATASVPGRAQQGFAALRQNRSGSEAKAVAEQRTGV